MANKYVNMTPEEIFENYTIDEIIVIQKEIQYEIDRKRQELRTMVGEHYRDVIEASDTIKLMQKSAGDIILGIQDVIDSCQKIESIKHIYSDEKDDDPIEIKRKEEEHFWKGISMQIKILIYVPEQIWTAIDNKQFLKAVQLYLFAQHIHTGLKFDFNKIVEKYPIIKTQWMKIGHFQKRISLHLHEELQKMTLTHEMAADYLSAYVLLENITIPDLLNRIIEFRQVVILNELKNEVTTHNTVKSLTCSALKLIVDTIQLIYLCFIDGSNGVGLVHEKLNNIVNKNSEPTLNIVELIPDPLIKYLPKIVADFRPFMSHTIEMVTPQEAGHFIQSWIDWVKQSVVTHLAERLTIVTTIKGLDSIREEALKIGDFDIVYMIISEPESLHSRAHFERNQIIFEMYGAVPA